MSNVKSLVPDKLVDWIVDEILDYMKRYNNEHVVIINEQIYSKIDVLCNVLTHLGFKTSWDYKDGIFYKFYLSIPFEIGG